MSNYIDDDFSMDEPTGEMPEIGGGGENFPSFFSIQLRAYKKVNQFAEGHEISLPDIIRFDAPYKRSWMKEGWNPGKDRNNVHLVILERKGLNHKTGEPFSAIDDFVSGFGVLVEKDGSGNIRLARSKNAPILTHFTMTENQKQYFEDEGKVWLSEWGNIAYPPLHQALSDKQRKEFGEGKPLYVRAESSVYDVREDTKGNVDNEGNPRVYYKRFYHSYTVYEDEAAMNVARDTESGPVGVTVVYPESWSDNVTPMLEYIGSQANPNTDWNKAILEWEIVSNGETPDTDNIKAILREAIKTHSSPLQANTLAAVDNWEVKPF